MSFHVPDQYRIRMPRYPAGEAHNGCFVLYTGNKELLRIIASNGGGWEHVSVSLENRCPTWSEMCLVKGLFWDPEDCVVQFHPPAFQYVNCHPHCLHPWRKEGSEFETPPALFVGPRSAL